MIVYLCAMRIIHDLSTAVSFKNPILTLGTFDGVHLGHQEIISSLVQEAKISGCESVLFTFYPHPRKVLYPDSFSVHLIDTIDEKIEKLEKLGLDTLILFPFTKEFSRLTAMEFVRDILVHTIGISEVHVGYDHQFGKNREGTFSELQQLGEVFHFQVKQIQAVSKANQTISSTKIRFALMEGNLDLANAFLGQPFQLSGKVIEGKKLGRTIGFPTANIQVDEPEKITPKIGVYVVEVVVENEIFKGMMSIGLNPTVDAANTLPSMEVNLLDFSGDLYGKKIKVHFLHYIREEMRFNSMEELKHQIESDEKFTRAYFSAL